LRLGSDPEVYARGIIKVCEHYLTAGIVYGARVSGSDLTKRIEAIMANNTAENLDRGRQLLVAVVAVAAVLAPFGFGVLTAPPIRAELPIEAALLISEATYVEEPLLKVTPSTVARPPRTIASRRESQDARPSVPLFAAFDEITITLNTSGDEPAWHFEAQRVALTSVTVRDVLLSAYGMEAAKDHFISELPAWAETERFDINAKASRPITSQTERNLMIMSILTDRFHLKLRGVTREMPVYALVVPEPSELEIMESIARRVEYGNNRSNLVEVGPTSPGGPIPGLVSFLQRRLDLPVVDRTGLKGRYRYRLEWDADRSSIFAAVEEQLGLKLEKQTGPVQMIVIDQLEKPTVH